MGKCATGSIACDDRSVAPLPASAWNLLVVSANRRWTEAVRAAAAEMGGGVSTCGARDAVIRLAGTTPRYSHLLLHPSCAEGLLHELVDLTAGSRGSGTEMLLLGAATAPPRVGVVRSASRRSVRQALAARPPFGLLPNEPKMHLTELRDALAGAMIETRYQPIVRLADREPIALEALVRLNHPTRGTLSADEFVPQIEAHGLAAQLTDLVADRALSDMAGPLLSGRGFEITLNFPLDVLLVPEALQSLDARRRAVGIPAGQVIIELTESKPVEDLAALRTVLERLRGDGYRVSIDDVSPTVPRVGELLDLPFTSIKLDKDVVQHLGGPRAMLDFAQRMVAAAQARGLTVVAEGVEDVATWRRVQALGVHLAQGFLVARPLPAAAVPIWLDAWRSQPDFA
jgi:EAL domain-containing protein (putative c-di-GMP-specific phosphodiesterase class I)